MVEAFFAKLEGLAFKLQYWYMEPKITRERVGRHWAFFHPRPTGKIVLDAYRKRSQIVLATGCFDILHSEHAKFLQAAKKLGGWLLVGLETDERVRQLKGSGRPINTLSKRITNLHRLKIADQVFSLPESFASTAAHRALIKRIMPDILAVSSHTPNLTIKRKIMRELGGKVIVVLRQNPKISTTKLLELKTDV